MFRVLVKSVMLPPLMLLAPLLAATLWPGLAQAGVILQYHSIADDMPPSTSVTPAQFARHLQLLEGDGFQVVRVDELLRRVRAGEEHDRMVAITFDDGFANIARHALPLLEQHGWHAAIFVTTAQVGGANMLGSAALADIRARGHLVLNHGSQHDHFVRAREGEDEAAWRNRVVASIASAQSQLEAWLAPVATTVDMPVVPKMLAWPYGEHSPAIEAEVRQQGFIAFGQHSGALSADMNWQAIPRVAVNQRYAGWESLRDKLLALPMPVRKQKPVSGISDGPRPSLRLWLSPVPAGLACFVDGNPVPVRLHDGLLRDSVAVNTPRDLAPGRHRYTCTAPAGDGRFYWYSFQWMVKGSQGWYRED